MDAVLQRLFVEIHDVAHLAVLQHKVRVELLLEKFTVLGDTLEFEDNAVIDDEIKAQVVLQTLTLVIDGNRHLTLHMKTLCCEFLGYCLLVDTLQQAWTQLIVYLVETLQQVVCVASVHLFSFCLREFRSFLAANSP